MYYYQQNEATCKPSFKREFANRHPMHSLYSSKAKAPVSIYKTDKTYEVLVFSPGRVKENFSVSVKGEELIIQYQPTDDTSSLDWIRKEYSRGGFERCFYLDDTLDTDHIDAKYEDGVLKISVAIKPGSEMNRQEVEVK